MVGTKLIIEKLTGNKKFEVDEKLSLNDYFKLIESVTEGSRENEDIFLIKLEESIQGIYSFKDDQDNFIFKKLVQIIKEMKKNPPKK